MRNSVSLAACMIAFVAWSDADGAEGGSRFASSDSDARYVHHIDLYDANNRKITAESDQPYSSTKTCGRCHDYETIAHGWHFNAFRLDSVDGREGEPWIWTDNRTGTQLPLSYRDWAQTYDPREIGITAWQMTRQFGGRIPGGGLGVAPEPEIVEPVQDSQDQPNAGDSETTSDRWAISGSLEIDCMICHAVSGAYDFNVRREQIEKENFAWAATAALRLGTVAGDASKIKTGSDVNEEAVKTKLPQVAYDDTRFASDGTVFMDLIRHPDSNACYQCHSNRIVSKTGIEQRWIHDEDVHLRAGMQCSDCHRNGIDHHIVRGFDGEEHPSHQPVATLSCAGCHLGADHNSGDDANRDDAMARAGRLGSPRPLHAGLPPIHFEKLSCTACHGGPLPREETLRIMTSLAHGLGSKEHRSGFEWPAIAGPVYQKGGDGRVYPHRVMWPAFWGVMSDDDQIKPLAPEQAYEITRRVLRVRQDFVEELLKPKLSSTDLKTILGEDRARIKEGEWTKAEAAKVSKASAEKGREQFDEKVAAALEAIEQELKVKRAVYVSSGVIYSRDPEGGPLLKKLDAPDQLATSMISWPMAHNVRPAGWSLGVAGCTECHRDQAEMFVSTVAAVGPGPDMGKPVLMATLQGIDPNQRLAWNQLFSGRATFKVVIAASLAILCMTLMIGLGATIGRWMNGSHKTA